MKRNKMIVFAVVMIMLLSSTSAYAVMALNEQSGMYQPLNVRALLTGRTQITLKWNKVKNGAGYIVKQKYTVKKNKKAVYVTEKRMTVSGRNTTELKITKLDKNKNYSFTVTPYKWKNKKRVYGAGTTIYGYTGLKKPTYYDKKTTPGYITTKWKTRQIYSRAVIYRANVKNGKYKKMAAVKSKAIEYSNYASTVAPTGTVVYKDNKVQAGKTYYYKVRSYTKVNGKKIYSPLSKAKAISAKYTIPKYSGRVYTAKGTVGNSLKLSITSNKYNMNTYMDGHGCLLGKDIAITSMQYSLDGINYKKISDKYTLKPGQTVYFILTAAKKFKLSENLNIRMEGDYRYRPKRAFDMGIEYALKDNSLHFSYAVPTN